jgi:hypothetical protein
MKKPTELGLWRRINVYDLAIAPSLAGARHDFVSNGQRVAIEMPTRPKKKDWRDDSGRISCNSWRRTRRGDGPLSYSVHQLDVWIETGETRVLPHQDWKTKAGLSKRKRDVLERVVQTHEANADSAYMHWLDVMRWVSGIQTVGDRVEIAQHSSWGTYLTDGFHGDFVYSGAVRLSASLTTSVTKRHWSKAQKILSAGVPVPLWWIYFSRAVRQRVRSDERRLIIELAVACEILVRELVNQKAKKLTNSYLRGSIDRIQVSRLLQDWGKIGFNSHRWTGLTRERKDILRIFQLRNAAMHKGTQPRLSSIETQRLIESVRSFLAQGDRVHFGEGKT